MERCEQCMNLHEKIEAMREALKYVAAHGMTRQAYHLIERALKNNSEIP